jgi:porin
MMDERIQNIQKKSEQLVYSAKRIGIIIFVITLYPFLVKGQQTPLVSASYTADVMGNVMGGFGTGIRYFDNLDLVVEGDFRQIDYLIYGLANQGGSISELAGDIQAVSNIETDNSWRLYEAWANIPLVAKSSLLVGLYDINTEFDVINTGGLFLNSSHGIGPDFSSSGITGPSIFPLTSLAARFKTNLIPGITFKAAILDAVPSDPADTFGTKVRLRESEGVLTLTEFSFYKRDTRDPEASHGVNEDSPFRLVLGLWKYSEEREGWKGDSELDAGIYAIAEAKLTRERGDSDQGLSAFLRLGFTNAEINQFSRYYGGGITYTGLLKNRDVDQIGLAVSVPVNGNPYLEATGEDFDNELIAELTYLWNWKERISLQFDAQYVQNPNQAPGLDDALVIGVRTGISLF